MRPNQKIIFVCLFVALTLLIVKHYDTSRPMTLQRITETCVHDLKSERTCELRNINCSINGFLTSGCFQLNTSTLLIDSKHLTQWFEVESFLGTSGNVLEISHLGGKSHSQLVLRKHSPLGDYMGQSTFNEPEKKNHILLIDPDFNIPISRQWDTKGHPYPVQIAQYGLAYYSHFRRLTALSSKQNVNPSTSFVDIVAHWTDKLKRDDHNNVYLFDDKTPLLLYKLKNPKSKLTGVIVKGSIWPKKTRLIFRAFLPTPEHLVEIHFTCSSLFGNGTVVISNSYWALGYHERVMLKVVYFLKRCQNVTLLQNLDLIMSKAVSIINNDLRSRYVFRGLLVNSEIENGFRISEVELRGGGGQLSKLQLFALIGGKLIDIKEKHLSANIEFAHERFLSAAEWFVENQQPDGSWLVKAKRVFTAEIFLKPGWCSAMGQGQGISLLIRAANHTRDRRFLEAANRALGPFTRLVKSDTSDSNNCGVRAHFLDQSSLPWFEEYPVIPSVFVLNGFIFSLIGLYDLSHANKNAGEPNATLSSRLLAEGLETLIHVFPLYDSGFGSFYDLRHLNPRHAFRVSSHIERLNLKRATVNDPNILAILKGGPNRARWQYHRVHLQQLYQLANVIATEHASTWNLIFDRWLAYMWGFRSSHN